MKKVGRVPDRVLVPWPWRWTLGSVVVLAGCSSPAAPPSPLPTEPHFAAGTILTIRSGETGQPVSGASVRVRGRGASGAIDQSYVSDSFGRVTIARPVLHAPTPSVDIASGAFLPRVTFLAPTRPVDFTLWPVMSDTGLDEDTTRRLVYSPSSCPGESTGTAVLHRLTPGTTVVNVVPSDLLRGPEEIERLSQAIADMNEAVGGLVTYNLVLDSSPMGVVFSATIGGGGCDGNAAYVLLTFGPNGITGGQIVFCGLQYTSRRTALHELGHTFGLRHSASRSDVMYCAGGASVPSPRERLIMKLMWLRPHRNLWPDNDREYVAPASTARASASGGSELVTCPGGL